MIVSRTFAGHAHHVPAAASPAVTNAAAVDKEVCIPELVDTLEWVLEAPLNVHQFDEPPVSILSLHTI